MEIDTTGVMGEANRHIAKLMKEADDRRLAKMVQGGQSSLPARSLSRLREALVSFWDLLICTLGSGARRSAAECP